MKIDITSLFFNSRITGKSATAGWATSVGQNQTKQCRIDDFKPEVVDMIIGMSYKSKAITDNLDVSEGSAGREVLMCSVFDNVFINNIKLENVQYTLILVREHSTSHDGRILICYAPYIKYNDISNEECINQMQEKLGCTPEGCWFVYDISIKNQSDLYFNAVVVNSTSPVVYPSGTTSRQRSSEWKSMIPARTAVPSNHASFTDLQRIYYGTPGSGKSRTIKDKVIEEYSNKAEREKFVFRTTFHPDSDYASFVGCYKPQMDGEEIKYEFTPQAFTNAYVRAWQAPEKKVFLIIEEINRGNCAQIFGDLFQLLDRKDGVSEYPITADTDLKQYLEKVFGNDDEGIAEGKLKLPSNLYIWATMNTSDQSLFPMDSAFKRRWTWECVPIDYEKPESSEFTITIQGKQCTWHKFLREINAKIKDTTDSEDKQMGNFFINGNVDERQFVDKVMFYLWNDVFKEEYKTLKNHFRIPKEGDDNGEEFTFNDLFDKKDKNKDSKLLIGFMEYLKVPLVSK